MGRTPLLWLLFLMSLLSWATNHGSPTSPPPSASTASLSSPFFSRPLSVMVSVPSITGLLLLVILLLVLRRCIQRKTGVSDAVTAATSSSVRRRSADDGNGSKMMRESDPAAAYSSMHRIPEISYAQIPIKTNCRQRDLPPEPAVIYSSLKLSHTPSPQCNQSDQ